jgi:hypothetical protein
MMRERNHSKLSAASVVDDAERKLPKGETAPPIPPGCAKLRMIAEQGEGALELSDECNAQVGSAFARIKDRLSR